MGILRSSDRLRVLSSQSDPPRFLGENAIPDSGLLHQYDAQSQSQAEPFIDQVGTNDLTANGSPTFQSNSINGLPSVNTDGVDDKYLGDAATVGPSGEFTFAWVGRYLSVGNFDYAFRNGGIDGAWGFTTATNPDIWLIATSDGDTFDTPRGGNPNANLHIFIGTYDGSLSTLEIDGTDIFTTAAVSPTPTGQLALGGRPESATFSECDFGEVLIYDEYKNGSERDTIRQYLQDRWGF